MSRHREERSRRTAALGALVLGALAVLVGVVVAEGSLWRIVLFPVLVAVLVAATFTAVTRRGVLRALAWTVTLVLLIGIVALVLTGEYRGAGVLVVLVGVAGATALARHALRRDLRSLKARHVPGTPVPAARHGVLFLNLRSGGGKAEQFGLVDECRQRGIEPVVLGPDDDLQQLAEDAVARGADVLGMAGGDGSQALVASVAAAAGVAMVCVPAGTRNHWALDLGLDRDDVVGALGAFDAAAERVVDLAEVNGRTFVNNVSLGVYAHVIHDPEYRDSKGSTTVAKLPGLLGPDAEPFDLRFTGPDGVERHGVQVLQVSNNPYVLTSLSGFASRPKLDTGELGIATVQVGGALDVARFVVAQWLGRLRSFHGFDEWTTARFDVGSGAAVEAGVDGEALQFDPPVEFRIRPGALRVRLPEDAPGWSPAALRAPTPWWTFGALVRVAAGRPAPIDESLR